MKKLLALLCGLVMAAILTPEQAAAQEATITPPESLVVDGVPRMPAALTASVGRYTAYRSASLADWHPDKREMLISTRFGDTPQLHLVKMPGGAREQLTFFADAVTSGKFHPRGGDYVVFSKDIGGGEWYQLYRYDMGSGKVTLLTDGKSRNLLGPWSSGGDQLAYMSTRRTGKDTDLWIIDPANPKSDHMLAQLTGGGWQPLDWSPDDKTILLREQISINEVYLWLVDTATGEKTPLMPRGATDKVSYGHAAFSKDAKGIYLTTDKDSQFQRLALLDLASKQLRYLTTQIPWDVNAFDVRQDGQRIAFETNEDGVSVLHLLDTATGRELPCSKLPVGAMTSLRWHKNSRELGFALNNARSPGNVYSLDVTTGNLERWTNSESAVRTTAFPEAKLVRWKSFDGQTISGFLYEPAAEKFAGKRPVLVVIHGGPEGQSHPSFLGNDNYYLNELGIALILPNVRGSTGYGKTFSLLDNGFKREDTYKDIQALFDWIATQPHLDAQRIAVAGASYGGHMSLAVSTFYSDRIRCSIDVVGISNLVTLLEHTEVYRRDLRRVEYGDEREPKMREYLEKIAPLNNVEKIKKPMLVVAGKNDPRVPLSESEQIVQALKKQGTPVWYLVAKNEGHGYRRKPNQDFQFYTSVEFLQEFLLK